MTDELLQHQADVESPPPAKPLKVRRSWAARLARVGLILVGGLVLLLAVAAGGVRLAATSEPGHALALRLLNGLPIGPAGHLQIEGLQGDLFGQFTIRRLAVVDSKGPWLDASDLSMRWSPQELLGRRFHAERLAIASIRVLRRPVLVGQPPAAKATELPAAIAIDDISLAIETLPAFSVQHGLWGMTGRLQVARNGSASGRINAQSRLHAGDGVAAVFDIGESDRVLLRADAVEAKGGALAGALGLPTDQALRVQGRADGTTDAGALSVVATSGPQTPLSVTSHWSKSAASVDARVRLDASRLTKYFADRAGPDVHVVLNAGYEQGDLFDLTGSLIARDAQVQLKGPIDWRDRNTPGLNAAVQLADLSHWATFLPIGATRATGVLSGDLDKQQYKGTLAAEHFARNGYSLARLAGPATFTHTAKDWRLQADLAGAGGSGQGLMPALLGGSPKLQLDLGQLPDHRLLFRQVGVQGSGLKLDAAGGQGLFGDLSFKGSAQLSNLASAHAGAHGSATASWSASQPKNAKAWGFSFDAKAANFASGIGQADHLLGTAPSLKVQASYGDQGFDIARADLVGGGLQAAVKGQIDAKWAMNLSADWTAQGPFEVGPVEIAGQAKGTGKLVGTLDAPHVDLGADLASVALGKLLITPAHLTLAFVKDQAGLGGDVELSGASRYGPAAIKSAFRFTDTGVDLSGIVADAGGVKAQGALSLQNGAPSTADLTVDARAGAFLTSGHLAGKVKLSQQAGGLAADIALDGQGVSAPGLPGVIKTAHFTAVGPWAKLPFQVSAGGMVQAPWAFTGSGVLNQTGAVREIELSGSGRVHKFDIKTLQPAVLKLNGAERALSLHVALGGGKADLEAHQVGAASTAKATLTGVAIAAVDGDYLGVVNASLNLQGQGAVLGGGMDATLVGARPKDAPANLALDGRVQAQLAGDRLHLTANASDAQGLKSQLDITLAAVAHADPLQLAIDRTKPMQGSFSADGELRPLWELLIGGEQTLTGRVVAKVVIAGTLNNPRATGQAALTAGSFLDGSSGLSLEKLSLNAAFDEDAVKVSQASGSDGHGGTMTASGAIGLQRGGGSTFALKLSKFRLFDNDFGRASVSGDLTVNRRADGAAKLSGALKVDRADIAANTPTPTGVVALNVTEINKPVREGEEVAPPAAGKEPPIALDVAIRAPRGIFIKGKGLNVELSLDAHVGGTAAAPDLTGTANLVLGSYDFAGKRFDFDQRGVIHLGTRTDDIRLDLSASLQEPTITAVVKVTGTAAHPQIALSSTPVLPQDEVLSQVLFGSSTAQLGPAQAAELASAAASLSRGGGFDLLGRLRQFAGLDRLALGAGTTGTGVAGGKYINDNVYVELIGGGREGPAASVEWRVRKNFSVISQVGTGGDAQLSIQFRKSY
ncbi:MAG: translocation/assembly module TamB domain-containing protein [Caulobacteraceae bacterium]